MADKRKPSQAYIIRPGDTLWDIAEAVYGDGTRWRELAKANNIKNPKQLRVGKAINVPPTDKLPKVPEPRARPTQAEAPLATAPASYGTTPGGTPTAAYEPTAPAASTYNLPDPLADRGTTTSRAADRILAATPPSQPLPHVRGPVGGDRGVMSGPGGMLSENIHTLGPQGWTVQQRQYGSAPFEWDINPGRERAAGDRLYGPGLPDLPVRPAMDVWSGVYGSPPGSASVRDFMVGNPNAEVPIAPAPSFDSVSPYAMPRAGNQSVDDARSALAGTDLAGIYAKPPPRGMNFDELAAFEAQLQQKAADYGASMSQPAPSGPGGFAGFLKGVDSWLGQNVVSADASANATGIGDFADWLATPTPPAPYVTPNTSPGPSPSLGAAKIDTGRFPYPGGPPRPETVGDPWARAYGSQPQQSYLDSISLPNTEPVAGPLDPYSLGGGAPSILSDGVPTPSIPLAGQKPDLSQIGTVPATGPDVPMPAPPTPAQQEYTTRKATSAAGQAIPAGMNFANASLPSQPQSGGLMGSLSNFWNNAQNTNANWAVPGNWLSPSPQTPAGSPNVWSPWGPAVESGTQAWTDQYGVTHVY